MTRDELTKYSVALSSTAKLSEDFDGGDVFGSAMGILWDVATILDVRGDEIPAEWQYRRGMGTVEIEEDNLYSHHETPYLLLLGNRCHHLIDLLREMEETYPHLELTY